MPRQVLLFIVVLLTLEMRKLSTYSGVFFVGALAFPQTALRLRDCSKPPEMLDTPRL
jgi:hypothetical protein